MTIYNITKKTVISKNAIFASTIKDRAKGLLGNSKPMALLIYTRFGIHTIGMKIPIDILILNNDNKVVVKKINLKPNSLFFWRPIYFKVLELPETTIEKTNTQLGDFLCISNELFL